MRIVYIGDPAKAPDIRELTRYDSTQFIMNDFLADVEKSDTLMSPINNYYDILNLFPSVLTRRKLVFICTDASELTNFPKKNAILQCTYCTRDPALLDRMPPESIVMDSWPSPRKPIMNVYHSFSENIGDGMNRQLFAHLIGDCDFTPIIFNSGLTKLCESRPCIFGVGSILGVLANDPQYDYICGSGFIDAKYPAYKPKEFLSVRGPLTRQKFLDAGIPCPELYGDLGLFFRYLSPPLPRTDKFRVGLIPHYSDKVIAEAHKQPGWTIIDICQASTPDKFVKEIHECDVILSSSLHGIIISDSYNIPAYHVVLSDLLIGGDFKFRDYYASVERPYYTVNMGTTDEIMSQVRPYSVALDIEKYYSYIKAGLERIRATAGPCIPRTDCPQGVRRTTEVAGPDIVTSLTRQKE